MRRLPELRPDELGAEIVRSPPARPTDWAFVQPNIVHDVLSEIEDYPRLPDSLARSALLALLGGEASVDAAVRAAGCAPETLGGAAADLSR